MICTWSRRKNTRCQLPSCFHFPIPRCVPFLLFSIHDMNNVAERKFQKEMNVRKLNDETYLALQAI